MDELILNNQIKIMSYLHTIGEYQIEIIASQRKKLFEKKENSQNKIEKEFVLKICDNNINMIEEYLKYFKNDPIKTNYYQNMIFDIKKTKIELTSPKK